MVGVFVLWEVVVVMKVILFELIDEILVLVFDDFVGVVLGDLFSCCG